MNTRFSLRRGNLCVAVVAFLFLLMNLPVWAASERKWSVPVPESSLASDASTLTSVTPGLGGTSLVIITHSAMDVAMGMQVVLISPAGKVMASADLPGVVAVVPVFVSHRRCVVATSGGLTELNVTGNDFVQTTIAFNDPAETLLAVPLPVDTRFVYTSLSTNGKVSTVNRYMPHKL